MGARGPAAGPECHALSIRVPVDQWAVYAAEAARLGLSGNAYVCSVLAGAHGLDLVDGQRDVDPQLALPLDEEGAAA